MNFFTQPYEILGLLAGILQIAGYLTYFWTCIRKEVSPNPISWGMFSYGTAILTLLEYVSGASVYLLILPISCSISSMIVMIYCYKKGTLRYPKNILEWSSFAIDVCVTICYVVSWLFAQQRLISLETANLLALIFLVCTNIGTFISFQPLIDEVRTNPKSEHPAAWVVWSMAYTVLVLTALLENGSSKPELLIYPLCNVILHISVAFLSWERKELSEES